MSLIHFDGFRSYYDSYEDWEDFDKTVSDKIAAQYFSGVANYGGFGTAYSRFGSPDRGLYLNFTDHLTDWFIRYRFVDTVVPQTVIAGIVFYKDQVGNPSASSSYPMIEISDYVTSSYHLRVCMNTSQNFEVYRGTTLLGTSSGRVVLDKHWHCLEAKVYIHASAGTVQLELDGVSILSLTSQDTLEGSNAYANQVKFRGIHNDKNTFIDAIWIMDGDGDAPCNDFIGDSRIDVIRPNDDGTDNDFTPSAGDNYENVDETYPDDDTTYNEYSGEVGGRDSYELSSLETGGTIYGVKNSITVKKTDAGDVGAQILTRSGGTYYKSGELDLDTAYWRFSKIYEDNPDDSDTWSEEDIAAMEIGVEITS